MRLDTTMSQRMEQKMILAPRMIQSMEILQLATMALQERIEQELQDNPVLERREDGGEEATGEDLAEFQEPQAEPAAPDAADPQRELVIDDGGDNEQDFDRLVALNEDWADHFNEEHRPSINRIDDELDRKHDAMINMASRPESLQDYLNNQLAILDLSPEQTELVRHVLSFIDENGWVRVPPPSDPAAAAADALDVIAQSYGAPVTREQVQEALGVIQKFDPPGVGARDIKECLLLQLTKETPHRDVVRALILNHLEDIQHNRIPIIQKRTGYDLATIQEAIEVLKRLNPRPGAQFTDEHVPYVTPDIAVEAAESGEYEIRLLDDWTPNVYISRRCIEMYRDKRTDPKTREFLKRKIQAAHWLIEAIEQRRSTLAKVTRAIIKHQHAFLDRGPEYIEPLKMQQIADLVGVHVTTVSRAVVDKWVQTPRGIFPLKRFFGGGTQTLTGDEVAWETIKQKLLEIIGNEDKSNPLSDEDLVNKLAEAGYPVARRTVTKYRKMLNIPSSRQRKVWGP
jgi:RNA polymerase sigma-54 factor